MYIVQDYESQINSTYSLKFPIIKGHFSGMRYFFINWPSGNLNKKGIAFCAMDFFQSDRE